MSPGRTVHAHAFGDGLLLPYAALSRQAYPAFRKGEVAQAGCAAFGLRFAGACTFSLEVQPLFPVPSCVLFAEAASTPPPVSLPATVTAFAGAPERRARRGRACGGRGSLAGGRHRKRVLALPPRVPPGSESRPAPPGTGWVRADSGDALGEPGVSHARQSPGEPGQGAGRDVAAERAGDVVPAPGAGWASPSRRSAFWPRAAPSCSGISHAAISSATAGMRGDARLASWLHQDKTLMDRIPIFVYENKRQGIPTLFPADT